MRSLTMKVIKTIEVEVPNLGKQIQEARTKDRRPLTQICASVGMSTQNWYRIESEKQDLPLETFKKIEEVLNVNFGVSFDD